MRAEIALLCGVIFRIDEDSVVGTRGHTSFATDTDRLVEIDDTVGALEHGSRWTSCDTRSVSTLITACDLMNSASLWKDAYINVLHIGTRDG